jgi:hypothetical protein
MKRNGHSIIFLTILASGGTEKNDESISQGSRTPYLNLNT